MSSIIPKIEVDVWPGWLSYSTEIADITDPILHRGETQQLSSASLQLINHNSVGWRQEEGPPILTSKFSSIFQLTKFLEFFYGIF